MAFIILTNNKAITLPYDRAVVLEQVQKGLVMGTPKQQAFAKRVKKIYFGKQHEKQTPEYWWITK